MPKLDTVDTVVATLADGVTQLRAFKTSLGEASVQLGNLGGELDKLLKDPGTAKQLADLRAQISTRAARHDRAARDARSRTRSPRRSRRSRRSSSDTADMVIGACAMAKLSGGGDKLKELCAQSEGCVRQGDRVHGGSQDQAGGAVR